MRVLRTLTVAAIRKVRPICRFLSGSPSRVRQAYQLFSSVMQHAVDAGYVARSPCVGVELPRAVPREARFLTAEEVHRLASNMAPPYDTLVYLLAYSGLRWGEAVALRRSDIRLEDSRIRVERSLAEVGGCLHLGPTKTWSRREVVVPEFLCGLLQMHMDLRAPKPDSLVFTTAGRSYRTSVVGAGQPLRHSNFRNRVWVPATEPAGLHGLRIHDLRHTCASLLISRGAHPKAVTQRGIDIGHSENGAMIYPLLVVVLG